MNPTARRLVPLGLALLGLVPVALGQACATAIQVNTGGAGGSGSSSGDSGAGSGASDAGKPDGPAGPCTMAIDCVAMNDACNVGVCVNGTCIQGPTNDLGACDDGVFCTDNDACMSGVCVGGTPKLCAPPDACHLGLCDEASKSCLTMPGNDGAQCDDMDTCTLAGVCMAGQCAKGPPVDCSVFNDTCAVGTCVPGQGCTAMPVNDGSPCNDGLFCTINDQCQASKCAGAPNPCAAPNNTCQVGVCNENLKQCSVTVAPDNTPCDDGSNCTGNEKCQSGQCANGQAANNGAACDDKNGCTTGTTCSNGTCGNPQSQINQCINNDSCCPANCTFAQDSDCLYWKPGVQENVPLASLVGWTQCYLDVYSNSATPLSTILSACNQSKLLLACRPTGSQTLQLVAMAPKSDVTFDTGTGNVTHNANGIEWYYNNSSSWGFAPGGDPVSRTSCDTQASSINAAGVDGDKRLCWHTGGGNINGGWRCGTSDSLNGSPAFERLVFQAQ
jgi:hypothetical protein